jgi:hypothetical protein
MQKRLGRSLLMPPIKPPTIRPRQQRDMCSAIAALMGHNRGGTGGHAGSLIRFAPEAIFSAQNRQSRADDMPDLRIATRPNDQI